MEKFQYWLIFLFIKWKVVTNDYWNPCEGLSNERSLPLAVGHIPVHPKMSKSRRISSDPAKRAKECEDFALNPKFYRSLAGLHH